MSLEEAQNLIMSARVALGLVDPDALMDLYAEDEEVEGDDEATEEEQA